MRRTACFVSARLMASMLLASLARAPMAWASIDDHPAEFAALGKADQQQARTIEEHVQQKGLDGLTIDQIRFAFEGKGAPLLRGAVIDAAEKWDGGPAAPLNRLLGLRPQQKLEFALRYKTTDMLRIMLYAQKIFDRAHDIPDGMAPIIKKYPPLKLALKMRDAGQGPVDPTVLDEWAEKQAAVAKEEDAKRQAIENLAKLKADLKKIEDKITATDKKKSKSKAETKNRAVVRKQLEDQAAELTRKIAEAEKLVPAKPQNEEEED